MSKLWFVGMAGPNSLEDLKELIEPIKQYFDGIIWTLHDSRNSLEEQYLESVKGDGKLIHYYFHKRHDESRNQYLWCGPMRNGDYCVQTDLLERLIPEFAEKLPKYISEMKEMGVNTAYYFGKPLIFEYHESLKYIGSPHESLQRLDGKISAIELSPMFPDESKCRLNVRPLKRNDKFQWVSHYLSYELYPWGANSCMLGLEKNGDPRQLFPILDAKRLAFREELEKRGYDLTIGGVKLLIDEGLDSKMKKFFNESKVLNDFYSYYKLENRDLIDNHDFNKMVKID